jgi:dipeptidyl aminopeptidase/acylaminoacyl peptidase
MEKLVKFTSSLPLLLSLCLAAYAQGKGTDFDIVASDGAKLRATYYSPGKPGPGILLLHQCNMNRKSWSALAEALAQRGVHVLTFDYRGYGETPGGGPEGYLASDIDLAFETLKSKSGVNGKLLAAGGASVWCEQLCPTSQTKRSDQSPPISYWVQRRRLVWRS